jgi:two-component system, chemotaxis family, response regulator Rcp1
MDRIRIFLAEDNPADVDLVREALREHGVDHELWLATDGQEAKRFIQAMGKVPDSPCPDLILLDLNLPMVSGHELIALFRKHPSCTRTPIIVVTSSDSRRDREQSAELGAQYFRKPSELGEFMELGAVVREAAIARH